MISIKQLGISFPAVHLLAYVPLLMAFCGRGFAFKIGVLISATAALAFMQVSALLALIVWCVAWILAVMALSARVEYQERRRAERLRAADFRGGRIEPKM